jgi:hypothetical protein
VCELKGRFENRYRAPAAQASTQTSSFTSLAGKAQVTAKWGAWTAALDSYYVSDGKFCLSQIGLKTPLQTLWTVNGQALSGSSGTVVLNGIPFNFQCNTQELDLQMNPTQDTDVSFSVTIAASVKDAIGQQLSASVNSTASAHHDSGIGFGSMVTPSIDQYIKAYKIHIGPWIELDPEAAAQAMIRYGRSPAAQR